MDGYNVIFAWDELKDLAHDNLEAARGRLMDILCNYAGYRQCVPILVFDAYKVKGGEREVEKYHNLYVVYTKEAETADMYIEKATHAIAKHYHTRVVTSDATEQLIILGAGALRVSSQAFRKEVQEAEKRSAGCFPANKKGRHWRSFLCQSKNSSSIRPMPDWPGSPVSRSWGAGASSMKPSLP